MLLTSTVAELLAGSSLEVVETGRRPLRGLQGEWKLLEAVTPSSVGS